MFLDMFNGVKAFTKGKLTANQSPHIDSLLFQSLRLCAVLTAISCVLVTARTYIDGDNINCVTSQVSKEEIKAVESYCFITSTFTLGNVTMPGQAAHPGVAGPIPHREYFPPGTEPENSKSAAEGGNGEVVVHAYYQWVPFVLAMQSVLLYLPYALWESKEDGYFEMLLADMHRIHVDRKEATKKSRISAEYFEHSMQHSNNKYFFWFVICEALGVIVAFANLFFSDKFLGGKFFYFGREALRYIGSSVTDPDNPLNEVFPKVGKCTWHRFGPSGSIESLDALCILPLNIVNEKTYVLLYVAYILLCVVTAIVILYHVVLFAVGLDRTIQRRSRNNSYRTTDRRRADSVNLIFVLGWCNVGDKFMLWCLQGYVVDFSHWLTELVAAKHDNSGYSSS